MSREHDVAYLNLEHKVATLEAACARYREALYEADECVGDWAAGGEMTWPTSVKECLVAHDAGAALLAEVKALREVAKAARELAKPKNPDDGYLYVRIAAVIAAVERLEAERMEDKE